jgi:hypothetical protein
MAKAEVRGEYVQLESLGPVTIIWSVSRETFENLLLGTERRRWAGKVGKKTMKHTRRPARAKYLDEIISLNDFDRFKQ